MRQINFLIIFVVCLAVGIFSLQNTQATTVQIVQGIEVEAPLAIELLIAMWFGAVIAWVFSIWVRLQQQLVAFGFNRKLRTKDKQIEELEKDVEHYKVELEDQQLPALSPSQAITEGTLVE
ncbi:MAG: LapA family protein [Symploca sp. SIO1B1]|nr:LapA family protein [Symploca sp. SIO2D2]NER22669.1 LapA family protein [Symploca sp. SIO1C2]NER47450.1 LapA family protein [Symploca sp. SIO1A3]NER96204.1 LapA family protein [Symploca sp. SIO1B1]